MSANQVSGKMKSAASSATEEQEDTELVAYNVEHVFVDENGRQVRKMPVEINGETIWVECVPGNAHEEARES